MATFDQRQQIVTTQYNAEHITTIQGISEERHERLAEELGVTRSALTSFFKILEQHQVPPEDLDYTLRKIARSYNGVSANHVHGFGRFNLHRLSTTSDSGVDVFGRCPGGSWTTCSSTTILGVRPSTTVRRRDGLAESRKAPGPTYPQAINAMGG
jgi:hypothetical protein